jgi:hypothetical protein
MPVEFQNPNEQRLVIQSRFFVDGWRGGSQAEYSPLEDSLLERATCGWSGPTNCARLNVLYPARTQNISRYPHFYPENARRQDIEGYALVACAMRSTRTLDCGVESETPEGWDFGESLVRLASDLAEQRGDEIATDAVFRVASTFTMQNRGQRREYRSVWMEAPTGRSFNQYYPRQAMESGLEGGTELFCEILTNRRLNCYGGYEYPNDMGFSGASLRIAEAFRLHEWALDVPGYGIGEHIRVPITFRLG